MHNKIWTTSGKQPYADYQFYVANLSGNSISKPKFNLPEYPFVDMTKDPSYNWKKFVFKFDPKVN